MARFPFFEVLNWFWEENKHNLYLINQNCCFCFSAFWGNMFTSTNQFLFGDPTFLSQVPKFSEEDLEDIFDEFDTFFRKKWRGWEW